MLPDPGLLALRPTLSGSLPFSRAVISDITAFISSRLFFSPWFSDRHASHRGNEQDQCRIAVALSEGLWVE